MSWSAWQIYIPKWMPDYTPPFGWQTVPYPMEYIPGPEPHTWETRPKPPDGVWPWWVYPKDQWPYQAPWNRKVLGAFQHARVMMPENYSHHRPTFGVMRVKTASHHPHSVGNIKVNMPPVSWLEVTPHPSVWKQGQFERALREMTRKRPVKIETESGSIVLKSLRSASWSQHKQDFNDYQQAIKNKREYERNKCWLMKL